MHESARNLRNLYRAEFGLASLVGPYARPDYIEVANGYTIKLVEKLNSPFDDKDDMNLFFERLMRWQICTIQQFGRVRILPKIYGTIYWGLDPSTEEQNPEEDSFNGEK